MWKKVLIFLLIAVVSLGAGYGVGYANQHGGFDAIFHRDADNDTGNPDDPNSLAGKLMTNGIYIANVRMKPDIEADVITTLQPNAEVTYLEDAGEWTLVELDDGREGYVATNFLSRVDTYKVADESEKASLLTPTGAFVLLRAEASTESAINGVVYQNDMVINNGLSNGWYSVKTASELTGYVSADLVTEIQGTTATSKPLVTVLITNEVANVRADANSDSELLVTLKTNDTAQYLTTTEGSTPETTWYHVLLADGKMGYVRSDLAKLQQGTL